MHTGAIRKLKKEDYIRRIGTDPNYDNIYIVKFEIYDGLQLEIEMTLGAKKLAELPPILMRFKKPIPYHLNFHPKTGKWNTKILQEENWGKFCDKNLPSMFDYLRKIYVTPEPGCGTAELRHAFDKEPEEYVQNFRDFFKKRGSGRAPIPKKDGKPMIEEISSSDSDSDSGDDEFFDPNKMKHDSSNCSESSDDEFFT